MHADDRIGGLETWKTQAKNELTSRTKPLWSKDMLA